MRNLKNLNLFALLLVIVGGVNWGLIGLVNFDLVATLFGSMSFISKVVYILVGVSAVYLAATTLPKELK